MIIVVIVIMIIGLWQGIVFSVSFLNIVFFFGFLVSGFCVVYVYVFYFVVSSVFVFRFRYVYVFVRYEFVYNIFEQIWFYVREIFYFVVFVRYSYFFECGYGVYGVWRLFCFCNLLIESCLIWGGNCFEFYI